MLHLLDLIENLRLQAELSEIEFGEDTVELLLGQRLRAHRFRHHQEMLTESSQRNDRSSELLKAALPTYPLCKTARVRRVGPWLVGSPWA
jgi:hypothetical protein